MINIYHLIISLMGVLFTMYKIKIVEKALKNPILDILIKDYDASNIDEYVVYYINYSYIRILWDNNCSCEYLIVNEDIKDILHSYLYEKDMIEYCVVDAKKDYKLYRKILKRFNILAPNVNKEGLEIIWVKDSRDNYIYKEKDNDMWEYLHV